MTQSDLQRASGRAAPALDILTRFGFGTKGFVTLLVGLLALRFSLRRGGEMKEWQDALWLLAGLGRGPWLLAATALGLICYGLFFILQVRYRKL